MPSRITSSGILIHPALMLLKVLQISDALFNSAINIAGWEALQVQSDRLTQRCRCRLLDSRNHTAPRRNLAHEPRLSEASETACNLLGASVHVNSNTPSVTPTLEIFELPLPGSAQPPSSSASRTKSQREQLLYLQCTRPRCQRRLRHLSSPPRLLLLTCLRPLRSASRMMKSLTRRLPFELKLNWPSGRSIAVPECHNCRRCSKPRTCCSTCS